MKVTTRKFDVSEHLDSPEMIREYLQALDCRLSIKTA